MMPKQRRWMKWMLQEAEAFDTVLPWERGADRTLWRRHLATRVFRRLLSAN